MKKRLFLFVVLCTMIIPLHAQEKEQVIIIETSLGDIEAKLYNDTPLHRDNMIKLVGEHYYDGQLFHRVIKDFMIQGGDPYSVDAPRGQRLGTGGPGYTVPAEFRDNHIHVKGALAAARKGDDVNPEKASSGSQFYIVQGKTFTPEQLEYFRKSQGLPPYTEAQIKAYSELGGTPHLDGQYTVFGEVIEGLDVLDKIAAVPTDAYDRPVEDVVIKSIKLKYKRLKF